MMGGLQKYQYIRRLLYSIFCLTMLAGYVNAAKAQSVSVAGEVRDGNELLPGVNVLVKGTQSGTTTDQKGRYSLSSVPEHAILVFSFIGYKTLEEPIRGRREISVALQQDAANLEEMVVIGYGTEKKVNITGAVDQISGKQFEARPIANVMQGLQGISPGLNITYSGGAPGTTPKFNIRGFTSINGGEPLFVIDGIAASSSSDLLRLNPSDIASFSVLRDAASSAIYGARAAFGVVLITTKQGGKGKQSISYNNFFSWGRSTVLPEPVTDPYIYSRVLETSTDNTPWDYVNYSDAHYQWAKQRSEDPSVEDTRLDPNDPTRWAYMGNNNWYDYFFNKQSLSQNHSVSLTGSAKTGNDKVVGYYVSADYNKENGLNKIADDYWNRYSSRVRLDFSPLKWLKFDNNLSIYKTERAIPSTNITDLYYLQPTDVAKNPDGSWANTKAGRLAAKLTDGGKNRQDMFGFQNIFRGIVTALNGDLTVTGSASFKRESWKEHVDSRQFRIGFGPNDIRTEGGSGSVTETNGTLVNNVLDLFANYTKTFGISRISILGGYNQEMYDYATVKAQRNTLISSSLPYLGLTSGDAFASATDTSYATRSFFGRINYTLKDRYILEVNGRYDGSSRFPASNRWGFFPSVSAAWIASSESFIKDALPFIPTLKLRASYGDLGNQNVGYYSFRQTLPTGLSSYLINGGQQTVIGRAPSLFIDPRNYTWERVSTVNFGADLGVLKDRLTFAFDYYIRDTKDMLTAGQELPGVLGTRVPAQNAADLRTKGWEFTLGFNDSYNVGAKPLSFNAKVIISDSKSRITRFKNEQQLFSSYRVGQEIGEIWGLTNDGLFKNEDEISKLDETDIIPWGALSIVPGWPKYKDLDGDGRITQGLSQKDPKDMSVIGNTTARYRIGFNLSADWNGFDVAAFLQGVGKADYYPHHYLFWGPYQQPYANIYPWNLDYYRGAAESEQDRAKHSASYIKAGLADANLDSSYPVLQSWLADANFGSGLDIPQTKYLLSAAYLRIKNVTVGYSLPASLLEKHGISRFRIFVSGENMFEFSKIKKYVDPESINDENGWAYPFQRKFAVGLNVEF
ncbi:TonB-dependent receptor [Dyadobacter chenwenxiniae]|uniref:TonB-dependent receptor n=1 Tax=Dyadobacter chenwenxiniae TaxID=2906456 RepID=A0A9X1PNV1_9BACT|nr:TonB-dependent receptor [Dyadobacter chenwenxiniae]MCF0063815.1 TonB-dependent receptor [Dyadobacter chenwenxiniae]UON83491.1 TonB-dependent receptor [Dyadobacter chenwenxiniae]